MSVEVLRQSCPVIFWFSDAASSSPKNLLQQFHPRPAHAACMVFEKAQRTHARNSQHQRQRVLAPVDYEAPCYVGNCNLC